MKYMNLLKILNCRRIKIDYIYSILFVDNQMFMILFLSFDEKKIFAKKFTLKEIIFVIN